jgi:hypothetical protein
MAQASVERPDQEQAVRGLGNITKLCVLVHFPETGVWNNLGGLANSSIRVNPPSAARLIAGRLHFAGRLEADAEHPQ